MISFPENFQVVQMLTPRVGAGACTSDYISLKNALKAWIVIDFTEGGADTVVLQPLKATAVLPSNSTAVTTVMRIWANLATGTSDQLIERTAATSYTTDVGVTSKQVIFEINPADLGELAGTGPYDCIAFSATAPNAADYLSANCIMVPRYPSRVATQVTAITD